MLGLVWSNLFEESILQTVCAGLAVLGGVAGALGSFAVVRKQALQGDAISHAALPGVAIVFLLGATSPIWVVVGGGVAGWVAMTLVNGITARSRTPFDTALAGALAVFFGFGLVLMTYLQKLAGRPPLNGLEAWIKPQAVESMRQGLDRYLFGQAAFLSQADVLTLVLLGGGAIALMLLFWKELKLVSFDRDFASSLGYPIRRLDWLLTTLIVIAVVLGLRAVGVVLMSSLLIAPATAARQWTNRLSHMTLLAALFGAGSGVAGALLSYRLSKPGQSIPTGPTVVVCATACVLISVVFSPHSGLLAQYFHSRPKVNP